MWSDLFNMLPDVAGAYHPGSMFADVGGISTPSSPGTTLRAWCALLPADTAVGYVGTTTKLWEYNGTTTLTDRSKGGGYTNTATDWSFAQYGNNTYATNRVDNIQVRDSSGGSAFADLAGSPPKARILVTQADQLLLFDLNDGAEKPDAFAASAPGDPTDWSGSGATTATRIRHRPGKATAACAFRDYVVVAKRSSVYKLTYTGSTYKWRVELLATNIGALSQHDLVNCGDVLILRGRGGAWVYDGASFRPIANYMIPLAGSSAPVFTVASCASMWDSVTKSAFFFQPSTNRALVYNTESDCWGQYNTYTAATTLTTYKPITGEADARAVFLAAVTAPEQVYMVDLSGTVASAYVVKSSVLWGSGSAADAAYLISGIDAPGDGSVEFLYSLLRIVSTNSLNYAVDSSPGDTELILDAYGANRMDNVNLRLPSTGLPTRRQSNLQSHGSGRVFDLAFSAAYARFQISLICTSGYMEIMDMRATTKPNGVVI